MITSADIKDYLRDLFELLEFEMELINNLEEKESKEYKIVRDNLIEKQTILTKMLNLITDE